MSVRGDVRCIVAGVRDNVEVVTERTHDGFWESRIVGGKLDGLLWRALDERQAVDRHVLLTKIARHADEF